MSTETTWVAPASNIIAEANRIVSQTKYYIWDVRNAEIFDNMAFSTIREVIEYGNQRLPHFWTDDNGLYKIREI